MTSDNLQFIAYEFQRRNFNVYSYNQDGTVKIDKSTEGLDSSDTKAEILVKKDGQTNNIREGRWLQIKYKPYTNGKGKFNIDVHYNGVSPNGDVIDSVEVDNDEKFEDVREEVFQKAINLI